MAPSRRGFKLPKAAAKNFMLSTLSKLRLQSSYMNALHADRVYWRATVKRPTLSELLAPNCPPRTHE